MQAAEKCPVMLTVLHSIVSPNKQNTTPNIFFLFDVDSKIPFFYNEIRRAFCKSAEKNTLNNFMGQLMLKLILYHRCCNVSTSA